jgi:hypothetical protein
MEDLYKRCKSTKSEHNDTFGQGKYYLGHKLMLVYDSLFLAIPITGHGGLYGCETLKSPHFLDNQLTDGGEVLKLAHWPQYTLQKHYFSASGIYFC